ncbi:MAG: hypothetical protein NPIRA01_10650 [Nitrospirales bacterium]|nr:MAG: hypothetical protein NPIRA01_10650 [Nitrospirales bacterium]
MRKEKLSTLCDVKNGYAFKSSDYVDSGYRVIRITNVQKGMVVDDDPKFISRTIADKATNFKLELGDILISLTGNVGRVGRILGHHLPAVLNQRLGLIRPRSDKLNDNFLFQYLNSNNFERQAINNSNGVAQLNLSSKWVENHKIPLPPLDDQIRIAHLLSKVEELIAQRKQHLQQLDALLKSVFLEMFAPTAPGYSDWSLVEIKDLAANHKGAMRTGPFGSNLLHSEFTTEGDVAVLGIDNAVQNRFSWGERRFISDEKYQELENYRIYSGDVIVTIMGTIGRSAVIPDDIPLAVNTKHLAAITLNKEIANPLFVSYSIHSSPFILKQFKSKNRGAIMSGLNLGLIKETKLKRPPIELQDQFAAVHKKIDEVKSRYQQSLTDLESLYGALSQKAFKGELDLSRMPLPTEDAELTEEEKLDTKDKQPMEPLFELPALAELAVLQSTEGRKTVIDQWLITWVEQLGDAPFSAQPFMEAARQRLWELAEDDLPDWGPAEYDELRAWIYEALEQGRLTQGYDEAHNRVQITAAKG